MIFQFVGYKNSGKTTAMEAVARELAEKGWKAIALKHHGHGGIPDNWSKDSVKHRKAGAIASVVEGDGILQMEIARENWNVKSIEEFLSFFSYDVLLVEGYKDEDFPKAVFLRQEEEKRHQLTELTNIQFIVPYYHNLQEKECYINEIVQWIGQKMKV
ncbi:molybdopterin-guanine dinucleotide biosynthesis protein B [Niallia sp. NCCP-28]|uniref:molybdopterin-guanine dinucleotide biosynthesis protein B n=1 Tax=Niallia sp. NCCP-28 TaxID=2934712 RepID=UPI0020866AA1|nr:molybdopterin-guanine dinucleotide biosynthesis protein B [Niallia sp. NCCP-28]GKU84535.1 molybdopterin-guanine dinucleotide biosynthesis protein MobB [Niallia sp. NCCP-28]